MVGKSDRETLDNMAKALRGYRDRDSQNAIPDKVEAYGEFGTDVAPDLKPHLDTLTADPLFSRMSAFALEQKVPLPVFQGMTKQFLSIASEMGVLEPPIDVEAERTALVPERARHLPEAEQKVAVQQRINDNYAFLDQMTQIPPAQGGLSKDAAEFAKMMLGDTARGHEFFEFLRAKAGGGAGPLLGGNTPAGVDVRTDLQRRSALPENTWGHPKFNKKSYDQLEADYKKFIPDA